MEANNIWITSDTHYAHKNLVRGVTNWEIDPTLEGESIVRDFDTLEEMNERMVTNINQTVDENELKQAQLMDDKLLLDRKRRESEEKSQ
jgi:calcineurin-like phosphoesterase family protein